MIYIQLINTLKKHGGKGLRVWIEPGVPQAINGGHFYVATHRVDDSHRQLAYTLVHGEHSESHRVSPGDVISLHPFVDAFVLFRAVKYSENGRPAAVMCEFIKTRRMDLSRLEEGSSLFSQNYLRLFD
ncbi:MAG: hypothetical protein HUJ30_00675 [Gammaproteobacteria bacterium]|nr:hypothetical protein [Gammaproteobacteria bacterium]